MIVIRASGSTDVKALRRLAQALSAEPADISVEEQAPPAPTARKASGATVSTLAGATLAPATRAAIMELAAQPEEEGRLAERWASPD